MTGHVLISSSRAFASSTDMGVPRKNSSLRVGFDLPVARGWQRLNISRKCAMVQWRYTPVVLMSACPKHDADAFQIRPASEDTGPLTYVLG